MRAAGRRCALALVWLLLVPCRPAGSADVGAHTLDLAADHVPVVYSADPHDPWNRIFELLYATTVEWTVPVVRDEPAEPALRDGQTRQERLRALHDYYTARFLSDSTRQVREHAADLPEFFFFGGVEFLLRAPRFEQVTAALAAELANPSADSRATVARVLFQQDLWNRFDAVHDLVGKTEDTTLRARGEVLRDHLGRLIASVAAPLGDLERVASTIDALAEWSELVPIVGGAPYMSHTITARSRRVFRSFIRVPEPGNGRECIYRNLNRWRRADPAQPRPSAACPVWNRALPDGTRVLLMETPVAIADNGQPVPVPLVLNLEMREIRPLEAGADGRYGLEDIPVVVLHGTRRSLIAPSSRGGLAPLAPNVPVPPNLSAFPGRRGGVLVPVSLACRTCHTLEGRNLMTGSLHGLEEIRVLHPDNTVQQQSVVGRTGATPPRLEKYFPQSSGAYSRRNVSVSSAFTSSSAWR